MARSHRLLLFGLTTLVAIAVLPAAASTMIAPQGEGAASGDAAASPTDKAQPAEAQKPAQQPEEKKAAQEPEKAKAEEKKEAEKKPEEAEKKAEGEQKKEPEKQPPGKERVLVLNLRAQSVSEGEARSISDIAASFLSGYEDLEVLRTQDITDALGAAVTQQMLGCESAKCYVNSTQQLGMDWVITGSVGRFAGKLQVSLTLIRAKDAEVVKRTSAIIEDNTRLVEVIGMKAAELMGREYDENESITVAEEVKKKTSYFHFSGYYMPMTDDLSPARFGFAYQGRAVANLFVGPEFGMSFGTLSHTLEIPGNPRDFDDRLFLITAAVKTTWYFLPDYKWVNPYVGLAPGLSLFLQVNGTDPEDKLAALEDVRYTRAQINFLLAPYAGVSFFPTSPVHFYLEARYDLILPTTKKYSYAWDIYRSVQRVDEDSNTSSLLVGGGITIAWGN